MAEWALKLCRHYGLCGGCSLQHLDPAEYIAQKTDAVTRALAAQGLSKNIDEHISSQPQSRRRVTFAFERYGEEVRIGFYEARSHRLVRVEECLVAVPEIMSALPALQRLLSCFRPQKDTGQVYVLATSTGLDIALADVKDIDMNVRARAAELAREAGFARLSLNGDILVQFRPPVLQVGKTLLAPPPGSFVQAVASAEEALAARATEVIIKSKAQQVADLFAGSGTFALRLAEFSSMHALESDAAALSALQHAARHAKGLKPITIEKRDLFRRPLLAQEFKEYDAAVMDPPRQGAAAQVKEIAKSPLPLLIYVSCNPASFARDAKTLCTSGFEITRLTLVDQFLWSSHAELIAVLKRPSPRRFA